MSEERKEILDHPCGFEQFTLKVAGKRFFCSCGCNVFHKPDNKRPDHYKCNACGTEYDAE